MHFYNKKITAKQKELHIIVIIKKCAKIKMKLKEK